MNPTGWRNGINGFTKHVAGSPLPSVPIGNEALKTINDCKNREKNTFCYQ